jgi:hypothetical protein
MGQRVLVEANRSMEANVQRLSTTHRSVAMTEHPPAAVVADALEERGLNVSKLRALLTLLEHDACWGCVPGTPAWASNEHAHSQPDRALSVYFAAQAARSELRAVVELSPDSQPSGRGPTAGPETTP